MAEAFTIVRVAQFWHKRAQMEAVNSENVTKLTINKCHVEIEKFKHSAAGGYCTSFLEDF